MQIPVEWYTHLLPGLILVCSFVPFELVRKNYTQNTKISEATLGILVVLVTGASYVVGFAENALIRTAGVPTLSCILWNTADSPEVKEFSAVRRVHFANAASPVLVQQYWDGYNAMIFQRSLAASLVVFLVSFLMKRPHFPKRCRWVWVILSLGFMIGEAGLVRQWWLHRKSHIEFINEIASIPWETMSEKK